MSEMQNTGGGRSEHRGSPSASKRPPAQALDPADGMTPRQRQLHEAWVGFGWQLIQVLGALEEDEYLIINVKGSNRFVQFAGQGAHGMRVEAVSNFYLPEDGQLDEMQHELLLKLGWNTPCNLPDEFGHEPVGSPNYFLDLPRPLNLERIASLAVTTLLGPLDASHPLELEYRAFAESGESIRFPTLGLRRAQP